MTHNFLSLSDIITLLGVLMLSLCFIFYLKKRTIMNQANMQTKLKKLRKSFQNNARPHESTIVLYEEVLSGTSWVAVCLVTRDLNESQLVKFLCLCVFKYRHTSMFLLATFFTTAGNSSDEFFPLAISWKKEKKQTIKKDASTRHVTNTQLEWLKVNTQQCYS